MGCFLLSLSLPPQILPIRYININISTNGKQDVLKQPEANTDLLYLSALSYYKCSVEKNFPVFANALLKKISPYLLSHFCIRIIVLTCPDNKSARNQPKSCVLAMQNHTNHNDNNNNDNNNNNNNNINNNNNSVRKYF